MCIQTLTDIICTLGGCNSERYNHVKIQTLAWQQPCIVKGIFWVSSLNVNTNEILRNKLLNFGGTENLVWSLRFTRNSDAETILLAPTSISLEPLLAFSPLYSCHLVQSIHVRAIISSITTPVYFITLELSVQSVQWQTYHTAGF